MKFNRLLLIFVLVLFSCGSDDDAGSSNNDNVDQSECSKTPTDQVAQGNFKGRAFTSPGGSYYELPGPTGNIFQGAIFTANKIDDSGCVFPDFEGSVTGKILFSLDKLEPQTISFSAAGDNGESVLNFNSTPTGSDVDVDIELACGLLEIKSVDTDKGELTGSIIATGVNGSKIDGNFTLAFCDRNSF